ncbi:MAG TPA: haloacid dehalogenase type II [Vineibacter sp.]|nr:haloacid dehalogenase type II [Vineibacter sp.]
MKLAEFTTLTFDCYGTLIDWEAGILAALRPWLATGGRELGDNAILEAFGAAESRCEAATPAKVYPEILADAFRALAAHWDLPASDAAARTFGASVGDWPAFPDSAAALQYLKRHFKLVILSNVDRASFARSNERLQVDFDHVFTAQDIGSYKPDPRNFTYLLRELAAVGIDKRHILHTAQSLYHDVAPARTFGLTTMWVNRRKTKEGGGATPAADVRPDAEVASMAELVAQHQAEQRGG